MINKNILKLNKYSDELNKVFMNICPAYQSSWSTKLKNLKTLNDDVIDDL